MENKPEPSGIAALRTIDYVIVLCDDIATMREFYANVLQLPIHDEESDHWVSFRIGSFLLGLRPRGRTYDGPPIPTESASIQLSFRVPPADVDHAYAALRDHDVEIIEEPTNQDFPHRTLFFRDPENNVIEIFADIHPRDTAAASTGMHRSEV